MAIHYESETCTRCAGSGRYSYCQMYGDRCFKCQGKGRTYTPVAQQSRDQVIALRKSLTQKKVAELVVGDVVDQYGTVTSVEVTQEPCGWYYRNGERVATCCKVFVGFDGQPPEPGCWLLSDQVVGLQLTPAGSEAIRALARTLPGVTVKPSRIETPKDA